MIFFEPKELLDLAAGERGFSLPNLVFGKRVGVPGGNAAEHKWLSRVTKGQTKLTARDTMKFHRLMSSKIPLSPTEIEEMTSRGLASRLHVLPWHSFIYGADMVASGQIDHQIPRTLDLVIKLDILSRVANNYAASGNIDGLLQLISELPINSTLVPDWVCDRLESGNEQNLDAALLPLRVVLLFATLSHMFEEANEHDSPNRPNVGQVFRSRDKSTGNPRPFRPCFERLLEVSGESTLERLFKKTLTGAEGTRIRQGRKYMAAPPHSPKSKACSAMIQAAWKAYDLADEALYEITTMFFFARLLTGLYSRCEEAVKGLPGINANAIMDEWAVKWRLDETEDADILRQMDAVLRHLQSSSD